MKKIFFVLAVSLFINVFLVSKVRAQSLSVGTPVLEDYYRRAQLLGGVDSVLSFAVRPLLSNIELKTKNIFDPDSTLKGGVFLFGGKHGVFKILPITWLQQFNSDHPYGWNDGAMIPARGYQTMVSGGFYLKYGPLSIQFRPEYVYANNTSFNGYDAGHTGQDLIDYYSFHNAVDWPERYGTNCLQKSFFRAKQY
jgi:hypothetical protein